MSKFLLSSSVFVLTVTSLPAQARYVGPLLVKESMSGFVSEEYAHSERCEIYATQTKIIRTFGFQNQLKSQEIRYQTLAGGYTELLKAAGKIKPSTEQGPVDGPTLKHYGYIINPNDSVTEVNLSEENGGSGAIVKNNTPEARLLKNVIDALCPSAYQSID